MGYLTALPIEEFRSVELVLDDLSGAVALTAGALPRGRPGGGDGLRSPGHLVPPVRAPSRSAPCSTCTAGGYVGTSPRMYAVFVAWLCRRTGCEVFVADLRLAPEFPFPAGLEDAVLVLEGCWRRDRPDPSVRGRRLQRRRPGASLMYSMHTTAITDPWPASCCSRPSWTSCSTSLRSRATPTGTSCPGTCPPTAYLQGRDAGSAPVSGVNQDVSGWPPTFVCFGSDEMFRDAIRLFVAHLEGAGVDATSSRSRACSTSSPS